MIKETDKHTQNSRNGWVLFLIMALIFVTFSSPCFAEPASPSPAENALALWRDPADSSNPGFNPSRAEPYSNDPAGPGGPAQETSRPGPEPSLSSSPGEAVIVLWQAPKPGETSDSKSTGPELLYAKESGGPGAEDTDEEETIADPLEPVNRIFFEFNDKFYFWALKPVSSVYRDILPQDLRVGIRNLFSNLLTPIRFANCLLQGEFKGAGNEAARFGINTTFGFLGMIDQAKDKFQIEKENRDFGQTLGIWGFQPLLYIEWPILGPSNVRDTVGFAGDFLLDPKTYFLDWPVSLIVRSTEVVNNTSLLIGDYESLKNAAIDPYVSKRDAYQDYRQNKIKKRK